MKLKKIQEINLENKKILLRADFNVMTQNREFKEEYKIKSVRETIKHILKYPGTRLVLVSHLGRVDKKNFSGEQEVHHRFSFRPLLGDLERILGVKLKFIPSADANVIKKELEKFSAGQVALLENIRFYEEEEKNDREFSRALASNFDIFVNEAFSVCHRRHASVVAVTEFLPGYAGFHLQKEVEILRKIKENPSSPAVAIIGGAKIETKLSLIREFEKNYDFVLVGGKISAEALRQKIKFGSRVILPLDFRGYFLDIGEKTISEFKEKIAQAKTIVWNGPLGKFEISPFDQGTRKILHAITQNRKAFSVAGGGESVQILEEEKIMDKISFVSTGGGAMLCFLSGGAMPGLEAISV